MAEPTSLDPVERNLAHERRLELHPGHVLARRPPARPAGLTPTAEALAPLERPQPFPERDPLRDSKRGRMADIVEVSRRIVEPEQQAPDALAPLRHPVPTHDA